MLKKLLPFVGYPVAAVLVYLAGWFVSLEANPANWEPFGRFFLIISSAVFGTFLTIALSELVETAH
jgi:preprotein translocase subunit SecY